MSKMKDQQIKQLREKYDAVKKEHKQMKSLVSVKTNMDTINELIVKLDSSEK